MAPRTLYVFTYDVIMNAKISVFQIDTGIHGVVGRKKHIVSTPIFIILVSICIIILCTVLAQPAVVIQYQYGDGLLFILREF